MSYSTEAVILVGRSIDDLREELDEDRVSDLKDECVYGITYVTESDFDTGYVGFTFPHKSFSENSLETFLACAQEDFKNEVGLDAKLYLLASWS